MLHCKKRLPIFPSPAGMSPTKLSLAGNIRESLVSDIPAGDGKIGNLFYSIVVSKTYHKYQNTALRTAYRHWKEGGVSLNTLSAKVPLSWVKKSKRGTVEVKIRLLSI
jgi:hypothetical protein